MNDVYREAIAKEVSDTLFASVEADETTDISCKSQMVIVRVSFLQTYPSSPKRLIDEQRGAQATGYTMELQKQSRQCCVAGP